MADRQRRRAPLAAALALLLAGCDGAAPVRAAQGHAEQPATPEPRVELPLQPPVHEVGPPARAFQERIAAVVRHWTDEAREHSRGKAHAGNVEIAVLVTDLATGTELAALDAEEPYTPASNMKLVTTAAALVLLGTNTEFLTPFEGTGPIEAGTLQGDLVVRAAGDPLCEVDGDARVEGRLGEVARALHARGIRRIAGDVVLDEGSFADPEPAPGWPDASQHWQEYCALAGGFSVNGGVLQARVTPRRAGQDASVEVHPVPHGLRSRIGVRSTAGKKLDVRVGASVSTVTVAGELPASHGEYVTEFRHPDPVALFGQVLLGQLKEHGIEVLGELRRERDAPGGERLAELRSPLDDILIPINTHSINGVADQLFLALGNAVVGQGTRAGGAEATALALERLGVSRDGLVQVDGSGLSRENRVTARQIATLIAAVLRRDDHAAELFLDSLAVSGVRGTLEKRLEDTPSAGRVHAKTGWISGASAIAGVCETLAGRRFAFSILVRYPASISGLNRYCFKPMQDQILRLLVEEEA